MGWVVGGLQDFSVSHSPSWVKLGWDWVWDWGLEGLGLDKNEYYRKYS